MKIDKFWLVGFSIAGLFVAATVFTYIQDKNKKLV